MPRAAHTVEIAAAPSVVWRTLIDVPGYPDWAYGVKRVDFITKERSTVGTQWKQVESLGPATFVHLMEITTAEPPRALAIESVTSPRLEMRAHLESAREGEATLATIDLEHDFPSSLAGRTAEPLLGEWLARTLARRTAEGLKTQVERSEARRVQRAQAPPPAGVGRADVVEETARLETTGERLARPRRPGPGEEGPDEPPVAP